MGHHAIKVPMQFMLNFPLGGLGRFTATKNHLITSALKNLSKPWRRTTGFTLLCFSGFTQLLIIEVSEKVTCNAPSYQLELFTKNKKEESFQL